MANQWFRLYAEIINDPKVMILTEALRWRYVALLCLQCNGTFENSPDDEIALSLRISLSEWIETRGMLIERRLLDANGKLTNWEKRQYISDLKDPTAAERQKRYRDNKRNERNATVTLRSPESDTDTETDTDKSKKSVTQLALLKSRNIPEEIARDWLRIRKEKRQPLTETALKATEREAAAAGLTLMQAITVACENSWAGFKAEYYANLKKPKQEKSNGLPWYANEQSIQAKGRELGLTPRGGESWNDFKGRISEKIAQMEAVH